MVAQQYVFAPDVERYRHQVEEFFPPNVVDKALWAMQGESGGNPEATGDKGVAIGLFQIQSNVNFPNRPSAAWLKNPTNNIRYAAYMYTQAGNKFSDWGDGTNGQGPYDPETGRGQFGALGNNPFPGDIGSGTGSLPNSPASGAGAIPVGFPVPNPFDGLPDWMNPGNFPWPSAPDTGDIPGVGAATGAFEGAQTFFSGAVNIIKWLLDPHHWFRLFFIAAGSAMIGFGLYLYVRGDKAISDVESVASGAAKAGEAGAAA